jgi:selenocysteine-specific elongation factor
MLIATAGHIDHGKTTLIRAITGVETDRLPEEKRRGISIDLGFAYWRPDGAEETIGFVDVPGHERFIRNMLAGVCGVEAALLVVAADDGVMPQTEEHVRILDLLGIRRAAVALTKCDRAGPERIDAVREDIAALLSGAGFAGAPVFAVSAPTGQGIPALSAMLREMARTPRPAAIDRLFRLAVDRAFTVAGIGTVVTGSILDGAVARGDEILIAPSGRAARVRGLQRAGIAVERAAAGQRCAVNLAGIELAEVARGDWLVAPELAEAGGRIEVRINALVPLKHLQPLHLHIGAADSPARLHLPKGAGIVQGGRGLGTLVPGTPVLTLTGDRFVLRDQSGRLLLGGGEVLDPLAPAGRRRPDRDAVLTAWQRIAPADVLAGLLAIPGHEIDTGRFERMLGLPQTTAEELYRAAGAVLLGKDRLALPADRVARLEAGIPAALAAFHAEQPEAPGLSPRALRARLEAVSAPVLAALLRRLAERKEVETAGSLLRLPGHGALLAEGDDALWRRLLHWQEDRDTPTFTLPEAQRELGASEAAIAALLHRRRGSGEVWRIENKHVLLRAEALRLAEVAAGLAARDETGFTAADYRDASGVGRNMVIRLLEFFDSIGVTRRRGDRRLVWPEWPSLFGEAS